MTRETSLTAVALAMLLAGGACAPQTTDVSAQGVRPARVGRDPVPSVHLFENHSSSLIAWRRAGVQGRVLVHLDGHADFDWLPDETVARLAAARPSELLDLEIHPYAMDGRTLSGFGIWNFIYPAARLGVVRELVWVVPDGTLADAAEASRLVRSILLGKMQMIQPPEAGSLQYERGVIRGEFLGLPVTICELREMPRLEEPVLLDIDLDFFTTRSAVTQYVTDQPWILPADLIRRLDGKGLRTDLATLSFSTIGGYLPPAQRWLGDSLRRALRHAGIDNDPLDRRRLEVARLEARGELEAAATAYRGLIEHHPDDATLWFALAEVLEAIGDGQEADNARGRATALDPLLEHGDLFLADRLWMNEGFEAALARYTRYLDQHREGRFGAYALRRKASCLMRLRRDREAIETYTEVVRLAPQHADSRMDLGVLLRDNGRLDEAIEQLRAARRILPDRAIYAQALGTTYLIAGRVEEGVRELQAAVSRQPCAAQARGNLSAALLQLGRYEEAGTHLRLAIAFQPNNPRFQAIASQLRMAGVEIAAADTQAAAPPILRSQPVRAP